MTSLRARAAEGFRSGDTFEISRRFTTAEIASFAGISRDYNPVHCDSDYAALKGMRAPIAHGLLTASLVTEIGGQIGWLAKDMAFRFRRPVYPDETLTCTWVIRGIDERGHARAEVTVVNGEGVTVLEAETTGVPPGEAEREHLAKMLAEDDPTNGARDL